MPERLEQQARGLVTVRMASRLLKIDQQNVYAAIWRGSLRGIKWRGRWRISLSEIRRYVDKRKRGAKQ
jgi:excisionase family DNA binding protein